MSELIRRRFADHGVVGDGSMGSELVGRMPAGESLETAVFTHPEHILEIHLSYLRAGAELIETATFGASRPRLARERVADQVENLNSTAVKVARDAREIAGVDCLVAGAIGPLAGVVDLLQQAQKQPTCFKGIKILWAARH